jgi:hypothetical protein
MFLLAPPLIFFRYRRRPPLLILRVHRCHGFFYFFKLRPGLAMSGAF